ncbi:MAG TPA: flagellin [Tepidisphaeraceae bacterium]|nr:flagellin [Tepidisphaeraceae bacterium]
MSSVINTNVSSLIAQRSLQQNNTALNTSLERLSTGLKINSGADDPAGLIASEALKAEQTGITTAIDNANRATNVIGTAEGGLNEVSNLLNELQGLVNQSANTGAMSSDEINANQLQVDSILNTVNRIANSTSFQGKNLLDGSLAYTLSAAGTSAFASIAVNAANLPGNKPEVVVVQVLNSATLGKVSFAGAGGSAVIGASAVTLQIAGTLGSQQLSFAGSTKLSAISAAINNITGETGVTASASGANLSFKSQDYGSTQFVSVQSVSGTFAVTGGSSGKAFGTDAKVDVNGAAATVDGVNVTYRDNNLDMQFKLSAALNAGKTKDFGITGGGATFSLGSEVKDTLKTSIGIQSVSTGSLGDTTTGFLSSLATGGANQLSTPSLSTAQRILSESINQVSSLRGRLGAFQTYTLGSTVNSLSVAFENITAANSDIADTNFAAETANLTRYQILSQAATTVLSQANSAPQNVLTLLQHA